jgi:NAD-dependent dihydropyrimidine dehydrogenase PreA subunit
MGIFSNRSVSLLTKHGKEKVIADVLNTQVGCLVQQTDAYDTDLLGTFTQETPRYGSQLDAVRKKAAIGMDLLKLDLGIANEGAFVNDPHSGMIPWNNELLLLVDQKHQLEITGFSSAPAQNDNTCLSHWEELEKFADNALFPSHYLVIKPTDEYHPQSKKGIKDLAELKAAFEWAKGLSSKGVVYVENDLRAFANPTRMENIRKAAIDLANKMNSPCPQCQTPGFWIKDVKRGLPCNACGLATDQEIAKVWGCLKCDHELTEGMKMFKLADPSKCHHCNP